MKVLFIYPDQGITMNRCFQRGVAYLSSVLKNDGVETGLIHVYNKPERDSFLEKIMDFKPDMLAYSSISNQYPLVRQLAGWSGDLKIYTAYGGVHPTIEPDECINTRGIDAICIGEGEEAISEFVSAYAGGGDISRVRNFWVKHKSGISRSPVRPLIESLDKLPFPDYDLFPYDETDDFSGFKIVSVQAGRGCPYNCTYCCNHYLRSLYPNARKYLRFRNVENVIAELKYLLGKYPDAKTVRFTDDTLSSNKNWFEEFTYEYKAQIGLPYTTNDHPHNITPEKARLYREGGCVSIEMGVENGNYNIRKQVMSRPFSDEEIINSFAQIRKENIRTSSFNIFGIVDETMSSILDTVKLNAKCKPSSYIKAYFQPFYKTKAYNMCKERGFEISDFKNTFFEGPIVELPTISRGQIIFGFKYFELLVAYYKFLYAISNGRDNLPVRFSDRIFTYKWIPYRLMNKIIITRVDIKEKFPRLANYLRGVKRFLFN